MTQNEINFALKYDPDYIGIVVGSPKSKRNVSLDDFIDLSVPKNQKVLVTVNTDLRTLTKYFNEQDIIIQLHGQSRNLYFSNFIDSSTRIALSINYEELTNALNRFEEVRVRENKVPFENLLIESIEKSDINSLSPSKVEKIIQNIEYFVLDTNKYGYGGTGICWDWKHIPNTSTPLLIAGGINSDNVIEALNQTNACGVDLSSGIEITVPENEIKGLKEEKLYQPQRETSPYHFYRNESGSGVYWRKDERLIKAIHDRIMKFENQRRKQSVKAKF